MKRVARLFEVTCKFNYHGENEVANWHCGSLDGAYRFIEKLKSQGGLLWYSIEGQEFLPCDEDDPDGQLYIGVIHHEFKDLRKEE